MKKVKMKPHNVSKCQFMVMLLLLLSSCSNKANDISSSVNKSIPNSQVLPDKKATNVGNYGLPYVMGGTYDSMSDYPNTAITCLNVGNNLNNVQIVNPQATLFFSEQQSLQEVENALGVSISITVGWGPFSVTDTYSYASSSQDDAYTLNINYIYQYAGTAIFKNSVNLQGDSALTPAALSVLGSPTQFRQMCGDNFISQMDAGASVLIRLTLTFNSVEEKNYFQATFLNQITGLANVLSIIENNPGGVTYNLTAAGIQVGGNPNNLNQIFSQNGGGLNSNGYNELNCGTSGASNPSCVNLVNQVMTYSSTIAGQLNQIDYYYLSNPVISPWNTIGIYSGDVNPSPQILAAMQQLTNTYNLDTKTYNFINKYENMLNSESILSSSMQADLLHLTEIYQQILSIYHDPNSDIMDCYAGFVSTECLSIRDNIMTKREEILNTNPQLNNLLAYIESNQYTAELVIDTSPLFTTSSCMFYPITYALESGNLFAVNCNGQVSGSLNTETGIQIIPDLASETLQINNLNYMYVNSSLITNQFSYEFGALLLNDPFYAGSYNGSAAISINGQSSFKSNFSITSLFSAVNQ